MTVFHSPVLMLILYATSAVAMSSSTIPDRCPLDNCLFKGNLPDVSRLEASDFCSKYLQGGLSRPVKRVVTVTVTPTPTPTLEKREITTITHTAGIICTETWDRAPPFMTSVDYKTGGTRPSVFAGQGGSEISIPGWFSAGCGEHDRSTERLLRACNCFLGNGKAMGSSVQASTVTITAHPEKAGEVTINPTTTSVSVCTSNITVALTNPRPSFCGTAFTAFPSASSTGGTTCLNLRPTPSSVAQLQIEGDESTGTIFDGCIDAGPRNINTTFGDEKKCDGTNAEANDYPGTTPTNQLDAAAKKKRFKYNATYIPANDDFFIDAIGGLPNRGLKIWGFWTGVDFTSEGGCQDMVHNGDTTVWSYEINAKLYVLKLWPQYAVAEKGHGIVTFTVTDHMSSKPVPGAFMYGVTSDDHGRIALPVPVKAGCYLLKATMNDAVNSNTVYLTVVDEFEGVPSLVYDREISV